MAKLGSIIAMAVAKELGPVFREAISLWRQFGEIPRGSWVRNAWHRLTSHVMNEVDVSEHWRKESMLEYMKKWTPTARSRSLARLLWNRTTERIERVIYYTIKSIITNKRIDAKRRYRAARALFAWFGGPTKVESILYELGRLPRF